MPNDARVIRIIIVVALLLIVLVVAMLVAVNYVLSGRWTFVTL